MKHRPLLLAAAVLAGALALAILLPVAMDWSWLRPQLEAAAAKALGRPVRINGPVSVRLLPGPSATLADVTLGEPTQARIERLGLELRLAPLLAGRAEWGSLWLEGGRSGWVEGIAARLSPDGALSATGRFRLPGGEGRVALEGRLDGARLAARLRLDALGLVAEGPVTATADEISIPDLALTLGTSRASFSLVAGLASKPVQMDMALKAGALDFGSPPPSPAPAPAPAPVPAAPAAASSLPPPPAPIPATGGLILPKDVTANLEVTADSIRWPGVQLERVRLGGLLDQGVIAITHATAQMPGKGEISLSGLLEGMGNGLRLSQLRLDTGDTTVTGETEVEFSQPPALRGRLGTKDAEAAFVGRLDRPGGMVEFDSLMGRWEAIPLTGRGKLHLGSGRIEADLATPSLAHQGWRIDDVTATVVAEGKEVTVERLGGRMLGGSLAATGRVNPAGIAAAATLSGADLGRLGLGAGGIKATKGRLGGQVNLTARGVTPAQWQASLTGHGRLDATDGVVEGFDLAAMDAQMKHPDTIGSLLGLIQAGLSGGNSRFSSLSGSFKADRGVITSTDMALVVEGGSAEGSAIIDLPRDRLESRISFRLATPGSPPLGLRLDGRIASPNKAIDINALQRWLAERGLGKGVKGKAGGLIESLLGVKRRDKAP